MTTEGAKALVTALGQTEESNVEELDLRVSLLRAIIFKCFYSNIGKYRKMKSLSSFVFQGY